MTTYTATAEEARAFWASEKTAIIVPMEPQPSEDYVVVQTTVDHFYTLPKGYERSGHPIKAIQKVPPFQPGERVAIKEPWDVLGTAYIGREYKPLAYARKGEDDFEYEDFEWQTAETMPLEAIRQWLVPEKVEARRVKDVTEEEAIRLGFEPPYARDEYICWWLELYPQYPYDSNPWIWYAEGVIAKPKP